MDAIEVNYAAFLWQCWEKQNLDALRLTQYEFDLIQAFEKGVRLAREDEGSASIPSSGEGTVARTRVEDFLQPSGGMVTLG